MTTSIPDTTRSIFHSATRFFSGTMLSRISGMLRDMCMAYAFGTQSAIAALLVAFRFAHLLRRLLGEGAMQTALIPHFEELRKESPLRAGNFFRDLTLSLTHLLFIIIITTMACLGAILFWGSLDPGNQEIVWLTFLMMPSLLFICLFGINASLLQCEKSYFSPSAAPVLFNLFWIIGILLSSPLPTDRAMSILSIFVVLACAAQWAITLPKSYAILRNFGVTSLWTGAKSYSADVLYLCKPLALGVLGVGAAQINNAMDAVFARWADTEGPAYLWYAIRLQQLPLALFGIALSGALLPPLARAVKAGDLDKAHSFLDFANRRTIALMLPLSATLFIFGDGCIHLIYGHGDFNSTSIFGTTQCLWGYTFGLIPMALVLVLAPAFYAQGDYKTPSQAAVASMVVNIGLNTLLVLFLGYGSASVAFATSISAWINFFWLANQSSLFSFNLEKQSTGETFLRSSVKVAIAASFASIAALVTDITLWKTSPVIKILQGFTPVYNPSSIEQILRLTLDGTVFLLVFIATAFATNAKDITAILKTK
ncbi:MAG: murein biosynthesis integral membrane protein MurJ [Parachlamydiaceae bacterium]